MVKRTDPVMETPEQAQALDGAASPSRMAMGIAVPVAEASSLDQLSRIEDKAARIEEKFARYEAVLTRAEATLERSAHKVDEATRNLDLGGLGKELDTLSTRIGQTPRYGGLLVAMAVNAVLTAVLVIAIMKLAPGLLGK